ncbi:equilibrative nucleoside transporter 1-like [Dysidea avara]|uniref:equilibrative nucleoside transporter 1-like n=1 Tax=Dysidea avara TaxID=196820 RepID=UPI0033206A9C
MAENVEASGNRIAKQQQQQPCDKYNVVLWIMVIQGLGSILPFNMFSHAYDYFSDKFNGTDVSYSDSFESYFSITAMVPVLLGSGFAVWLQARIAIKFRYIVSTTMIIILLAVTALFVKVPTENWVRGFFIFTLITLFVLNCFASVYQSSILGLAGILGRRYVSAVMSGQSVAGLFSTIAAIISAAIDPITSGRCKTDNAENIALGYFLSAVIIMTVCLVTFLIQMRMGFTQYYLQIYSTANQKPVSTSQEASRTEKTPLIVKRNNESERFEGLLSVINQIWFYAISVFMIFAVTLSVFPAVLTNIRSVSYQKKNPEDHPWSDCLFVPLTCFLVFNTGDLVGRIIPQWIIWPRNKYAILVLALCRSAFIPLFLMCYHKDANKDDVIFRSDIFPVAFNAVLSVSNGYLATLCMVLAPRAVNSRSAESASAIMTFFLSSGLTVGAFLSFVMLTINGVDVMD